MKLNVQSIYTYTDISSGLIYGIHLFEVKHQHLASLVEMNMILPEKSIL